MINFELIRQGCAAVRFLGAAFFFRAFKLDIRQDRRRFFVLARRRSMLPRLHRFSGARRDRAGSAALPARNMIGQVNRGAVSGSAAVARKLIVKRSAMNARFV